jgi:uncharacterized protein YbbC (DUF1343 family)
MVGEPLPSGTARVTLGVDRFLEDADAWGLEGTRMGLLSNDGARPASLAHTPTRVALREAGIDLTHLFSPEHGLSASTPDGVAVPHGSDVLTGLPVTSLYGARLQPEPKLLESLDSILVDLQDVGARFYTYLWTLTYLMDACSQADVSLVVLDRPNPLGGLEEWVEGPLPDAGSPATFLGRWPIPVRHSMTLGEMALLLRAEMGLELELLVIPMKGWNRDMLWRDTGLPFHPPSPGIPSPESALLYPGLALLEATNVQEGRGTDWSFRWVGAPWMEEGGGTQSLAHGLNALEHAGVRARPHDLVLPGNDEPCPGVLLDIHSPREVRPVALGLRVLALLLSLWRNRFSWTPYPTAVNPSGRGHLLRLLARSDVVDTLEQTPEQLDKGTVDRWTEAPGWWRRVGPHLLYGSGTNPPPAHGPRSHP